MTTPYGITDACPSCKGAGRTPFAIAGDCAHCDGTGLVPRGSTVLGWTRSIPASQVKVGDAIRVRGERTRTVRETKRIGATITLDAGGERRCIPMAEEIVLVARNVEAFAPSEPEVPYWNGRGWYDPVRDRFTPADLEEMDREER